MSTNPNFDPLYSTNQIWRDENTERCLTDDLDAIEAELARKAPGDHDHEGYAPENHTHEQASITGLIAALAGMAAADHGHPLTQIIGLIAALAAKADLVNGKVPESQLPSYVDDVVDAYIVSGSTAFSAGWLSTTNGGTALTPEAGKVYIVLTSGEFERQTYRWSGTVYAPIGNDIALGETSATAYRGDRGKTAYEHSQNGDVHVTTAQKSAWDGKAAGDHTHAISAIPGLLDMLITDTAGRQQLTITGNVLTTIAGLTAGVLTAYSAGGSSATATNAPNTIESWRYLIHKNYTNYGWVLAFGSEGSFFLNYIDGGVWRGWKPIWDNNPAPLWTGVYYMNGNQTIYPAKKLSECKNGWVLLWSDYDTANSAATNGDVVATYIPKRCYSGGNWSGHSWLVDIPVEASAAAESRCIKKLYMWNDRIVGNAINETSPRNDVVLRAVFEF